MRYFIPVWYINKFTIIDFTIYTRLFLVKLKSVVDGPILHSKSVVDRSILHCKAKVCVFSKINGKIINIPYRNVYQRTWKLVDCNIYNSSTRGKSIQNQSVTPFSRCGLTLDWFTTREIITDFAIHQLSGSLIHIPVWYINNFTIIYFTKKYILFFFTV